MKRTVIGIVTVLCVCCAAPLAHAADEPVFEIEMKDGVITPSRFERSRQDQVQDNRQEHGAKSGGIRKPGAAQGNRRRARKRGDNDFSYARSGEYKFFDDFQPGAPAAVLIAK